MPLGTLILRISDGQEYTVLSQTFASILGMIGAGIGIYMSTLYNRVSYSLEFFHAALTFYQEQEIQLWPSSLGLIVISAMFIQLILGIMHYRIYKNKPNKPQNWHPFTSGSAASSLSAARPTVSCKHILSPKYQFQLTILPQRLPSRYRHNYDYILLAFVLLVAIVTVPILIFTARRRARKAREAKEAK